MIAPLPPLLFEPVVRSALLEDLGRGGDLTSQACLPPGAQLKAQIVARAPGRLAGLACASLAFRMMDPEVSLTDLARDGDDLSPGQAVLTVEGAAAPLLAAERTALNLLGRLCGIATLTRAYVEAVAGTGARIVDTRKTTPGLRALEKYAVRCGSGFNHRLGLDDAVLIKDNHVAVCGGVAAAVHRARQTVGHLVCIEVEIDRLDQLDEALDAGPDVIMLDNFPLADLAEAVERVRAGGRPVRLEASGGISLKTVRAVAETGVDVISVGALTHSAPVLDLGLDAL